MRIHPFVVAAVLLLAGVTVFGATLIVERHGRRTRRRVPVAEAPERPGSALAPRSYPEMATFRPLAVPPVAVVPTGVLRLRVTGPHGLVVPAAEIVAVRRGAGEDAEVAIEADEDEPGTFAATELEPGLYDVRVEAPGLRPARLAMPTGQDIVLVSLARAALLRGALGMSGDQDCAGVRVTATAAAPQAGSVTIDTHVNADDCSFVLEDLPETGPLMVVAKGRQWRESALVTLPVAGDPAPLCSRAPCVEPPASLVVYVVDASGREVDEAAFEWSRESETEGELGSTTTSGVTFLHGRRVGQVLRLRASTGEGAVEATAVVGPGVTDVVLRLPIAAADQ